MKFGLHLPHVGPTATREGLLGFAKAADSAGIDSLWVSDHVIVPRNYGSKYPYDESGKMPIPDDAPFLEAIATLLAVSGVTERAQLGTSVLVLPQRQALLVAKQWATLDVISGGRTIFGYGIGWMREEFEALQMPFEGRGGRGNEAIRLILSCWADETIAFEGKHYRLAPLAVEPKPLQKPRPPIWVGGHTPSAFRRVARYADAWHGGGPANLCGAALAACRAEAEKIDRDPASVGLTIRMGSLLDVSTREAREKTIEEIRPYIELGADHFVFLCFDPPEKMPDTVGALMNEVKPAVS